MTSPSLQVIRKAEACAELGRYHEAWALLESVPAMDRTTGSAFAVMLLICTGVEKWELGSVLVRRFNNSSPEPQREKAGRFLLAYASSLEDSGRVREARMQLHRLTEIWPRG